MEKKINKAIVSADVEENQYVTFLIDKGLYGVDVIKVQEIIGMVPITIVPNSAAFMRGVINLRGAVVPVIDMRTRFRMTDKSYDSFTVIIIVEVNSRLVGMIVDSVSDVVKLPVESIQNTPNFNAEVKVDFIEGIGQIDDNLVAILDVNRILSAEELPVSSESA
jgi:purine-binding chemotaxis protein CheW